MAMNQPNLSDYQSVTDFLFTQLPMFQRVGGAAYKKNLTNTIKLCNALGNPEKKFKSVHIAGTNGKGSCSHYTAAILQAAGYKTGLYTSPHLKNFTERIKINGSEISQLEVVKFVQDHQLLIEEVKPSFFEITVAMAFDYFAKQKVDIAIVEVGMGGRLDSTNVLTPEVTLITNISKDHQQFLGDSIEEIAGEKAGIVKKGVPLVVSERDSVTDEVFKSKAQQEEAQLVNAQQQYSCQFEDRLEVYNSKEESVMSIEGIELVSYQLKNIPAVLTVIDLLNIKDFEISSDNIKEGLINMKTMTGLKGRWQTLQQKPRVICDVGHNVAGVKLIMDQLKHENYNQLHIVWGTVNDKELLPVLSLLPIQASYYFCQANIPRAMSADELRKTATEIGLIGSVYQSVSDAVAEATKKANEEDLIFVGGSTFVVAEVVNL